MVNDSRVAVVFHPGPGEQEAFASSILRLYTGCDLRVLRYGTIDGTDDDIRGMCAEPGFRCRVEHLAPGDDRFRYIMNDLMSIYGEVVIDTTFASSLHAAMSGYLGVGRSVEVVHCRPSADGVERIRINPPVRNYHDLDDTDMSIVEAVRQGPATVSDILGLVDAPEKTVYRRADALVKGGYINARRVGKSKELSLDPDQAYMLFLTRLP